MKHTKIKIDDFQNYRCPSNVQFSPNGKLIAFNVTSVNKKEDRYQNDVYLLQGDKLKQLTNSIDAHLLFFENDEKLIIRRSTKETKKGETDIYYLDLNGGEAQPYFTLPFGVNRLIDLGDHKYAAVGIIDSENPDIYKLSSEERIKLIEEKEKLNKEYQVVDEVPYWFNGGGFINKERSALFFIDNSDGLKIKRLTSPTFDTNEVLFANKKVYFTGISWEGKVKRYDNIYQFDLKDEKVSCLYRGREYSMWNLFYLEKDLYVQASDELHYGVNETKNIYRLRDGKLKLIYKPEVSLYNSVTTDTLMGGGKSFFVDGKHLYTLATNYDHTAIYEFDKTFKKRAVFDRLGLISCMDIYKDKVVVVRMDEDHLAELYLINKVTQNIKQLTHLNDEVLKDKYIAKPKRISYKSQGLDLKGWVLLPENFEAKKKYPAILSVHGGPRVVYGDVFFHEMQVWVNKGYVVMFTNIAGSDGRGDAFADIRGRYGEIDYQNLMDFVDVVLKRYPNIDQKKLCETGGSYGGFMTNWIITHTDRFCACVSQRSIANWISMSFTSDIGLHFGIDQCGGEDVYSEFDRLLKHSPLAYAKTAKTPTLFIHSDEDYRCPLSEGMQMMQALSNNGVDTKMVIFKGENHDLSRSGKPSHRIRRMEEICAWFDKYTKGK